MILRILTMMVLLVPPLVVRQHTISRLPVVVQAFRSTTFISRRPTTTTTTRLHQQTQQSLLAPLETHVNRKCWRPTVNDVERISWGKPAKHKGVGSRGVPHRLNAEERAAFERARTAGFLQVTGSGWRSERRDAPLVNTYRSFCDARAQVAIVIHKRSGGGSSNGGDDDVVVVDLSPLRNPAVFNQLARHCLQVQPHGTIMAPVDGPQETCREDGEYGGDDDDHKNNETAATTIDKQQQQQQEEEASPSTPWETKPIYQLPPYQVIWSHLSRPEAKQVGKKLSQLFATAERRPRASSKKPFGVKPGKSRRHGGYGIG